MREVSNPGIVVASRLYVPWAESTLTFNTQPQPQVAETYMELTTAHAENFALLDVTPLVQAWAAGEPNHGLAVIAAVPFTYPGASAIFDSKENPGTSHAPEIEVILERSGYAGARRDRPGRRDFRVSTARLGRRKPRAPRGREGRPVRGGSAGSARSGPVPSPTFRPS